ncbi:MAG: LPXTG cell wall anchor domain-containing protein [Enterococcus casseliflavus]|uniref:LPXTG cell wall anchor domain-containing protein n=1 Tax=Enterococcus casseliflavus TaxID=37734 RepID=UPI0022E6A5D9|nr:LPXTG cell wall anchor domain-containing protein [Enterococcus casseliflavus]
MKKRKRIVLFVAVLLTLTLTVWDLSETSVAEATTGQVSVTGRIGETVTQEEEADDDNKKTIVADGSQIGQGKLPQTGSSNTSSLIILGYALLVLFVVTVTRKKKHGESVAP